MSVRINAFFFFICTFLLYTCVILSQVRKLLPDTKITFALAAENSVEVTAAYSRKYSVVGSHAKLFFLFIDA